MVASTSECDHRRPDDSGGAYDLQERIPLRNQRGDGQSRLRVDSSAEPGLEVPVLLYVEPTQQVADEPGLVEPEPCPGHPRQPVHLLH